MDSKGFHLNAPTNVVFATFATVTVCVSCIVNFGGLGLAFADTLFDLLVITNFLIFIFVSKKFNRLMLNVYILIPLSLIVALLAKDLVYEAAFLFRNFVYLGIGTLLYLAFRDRLILKAAIISSMILGLLLSAINTETILSGFVSRGALGYASFLAFVTLLIDNQRPKKLNYSRALGNVSLSLISFLMVIISSSKTAFVAIFIAPLAVKFAKQTARFLMILALALFVVSQTQVFVGFYSSYIYGTALDFPLGSFLMRIEDRHAVGNEVDWSWASSLIGPNSWIGPSVSQTTKHLGSGDGLLPFLLGNFGALGMFSFLVVALLLKTKGFYFSLSIFLAFGLTRNVLTEDILLLTIGVLIGSEIHRKQILAFTTDRHC